MNTITLEGKPPVWAKNVDLNTEFYFVNNYGEQWIAIIDNELLKISGLDIGWKEIHLDAHQIKSQLHVTFKDLLQYHGDFENMYNEYPLARWVFNSSEKEWIYKMLRYAHSKLNK